MGVRGPEARLEPSTLARPDDGALPSKEDPMCSRNSFLAVVLALAVVQPCGAVWAADPGVTATEIKIGNIAPYSGPASAYGTIGKTIGAWFKKVNEESGVNGRKIVYVSLDDGYS